MQEVYERLLRYRSDVPIAEPLSYVFQVAWNVLKANAQHSRSEQTRSVSCDAPELARLGEQVGKLWVLNAETAVAEEELEQLLNRLPRACKIALIRQRRDGYSYQQIADELHVSVSTVKDYIVRALNECRAHFSMPEEN